MLRAKIPSKDELEGLNPRIKDVDELVHRATKLVKTKLQSFNSETDDFQYFTDLTLLFYQIGSLMEKLLADEEEIRRRILLYSKRPGALGLNLDRISEHAGHIKRLEKLKKVIREWQTTVNLIQRNPHASAIEGALKMIEENKNFLMI
jgi:hypothetical protein